MTRGCTLTLSRLEFLRMLEDDEAGGKKAHKTTITISVALLVRRNLLGSYLTSHTHAQTPAQTSAQTHARIPPFTPLRLPRLCSFYPSHPVTPNVCILVTNSLLGLPLAHNTMIRNLTPGSLGFSTETPVKPVGGCCRCAAVRCAVAIPFQLCIFALPQGWWQRPMLLNPAPKTVQKARIPHTLCRPSEPLRSNARRPLSDVTPLPKRR